MSSSPESVRNVGINDQSTGDDYLGFEPYVTAIATVIVLYILKVCINIFCEYIEPDSV
ncbi:MAG: hypothetical protein VKL41_01900 [Snowella sp.]|nr:hypothetical protein [Snowella sp.]